MGLVFQQKFQTIPLLWGGDSLTKLRRPETDENTNHIKEQIIEAFRRLKGNSIHVATLLSFIDFTGLFQFNESAKHTNHSVIKLYLFKVIKGLRNYKILLDSLQNNHEEAFQLGFYKSNENNIDLPPKRTFNNYLAQLDKKQLDSIAEFILETATKNNIVLDLEIVKKAIKEKKSNNDKEIREAIKLIRKLIYPQIDLKIKSNGKFTTYNLLDVLVHVALTNDFVHNGSETFKACNGECPSGDLMMYHFSKFKSVEQVRIMFEKISDFIFTFARRNYNVLNHRKHDIAYDVHKIPYFGKGIQYSCGDKYERGTSNFLEFLTCSIVVAGRRFVVDVTPIHPLDDIPKLLDRSLQRVKNKLKIDRAYLDRGFNGAEYFRVLKKNKIKFLMPMVRSNTVKAAFDKAEGINSYVFHDFKVGEESINLILVDDEQGLKRAFVSNFDIAPCLAYRLYGLYSQRWGIETGYRNLDHDFQARTTTRNYHIRLFYFLFSVCLFNLWVLVNICVSLSVYGRIKDKPLITAKLFAILLSRVKEEINDSGS
jgi:putative transposase